MILDGQISFAELLPTNHNLKGLRAVGDLIGRRVLGEEICKIRQFKWKIFHVCITGWTRHAHQTYYSSLTKKRGVSVGGTERDDQ